MFIEKSKLYNKLNKAS